MAEVGEGAHYPSEIDLVAGAGVVEEVGVVDVLDPCPFSAMVEGLTYWEGEVTLPGGSCDGQDRSQQQEQQSWLWAGAGAVELSSR